MLIQQLLEMFVVTRHRGLGNSAAIVQIIVRFTIYLPLPLKQFCCKLYISILTCNIHYRLHIILTTCSYLCSIYYSFHDTPHCFWHYLLLHSTVWPLTTIAFLNSLTYCSVVFLILCVSRMSSKCQTEVKASYLINWVEVDFFLENLNWERISYRMCNYQK